MFHVDVCIVCVYEEVREAQQISDVALIRTRDLKNLHVRCSHYTKCLFKTRFTVIIGSSSNKKRDLQLENGSHVGRRWSDSSSQQEASLVCM